MSRSSRRQVSRWSSDPGRPSETSSRFLRRRAKVREAVPARKGAAHDSVSGLVDDLLAGNKRAAGKLISLNEDDEPEATAALGRIFPHTTRAHTTVVVEMPMTGDAVQTMKAGILEIGDVYVVNKADLGNEDVLVANLKFQLTARDGWIPSVIRTAATEGRGIDELADALDRHAAYLDQTGFRAKREVARARLEILENAQRLLSRRVANRSRMGRAFDALAEDVAARRLDPHAAARKLL